MYPIQNITHTVHIVQYHTVQYNSMTTNKSMASCRIVTLDQFNTIFHKFSADPTERGVKGKSTHLTFDLHLRQFIVSRRKLLVEKHKQ